MQVDLRILRYDPERDDKPHWEGYTVESDPKMDRVLDLLHRVKYEQDGTLTFRRSCAHGVCGSDAMLINGRNRLACKLRVEQLGKRRITVAPLPGLPVVKDLVVDMDGFFDKLRSVKPYLVNDSPAPERERIQTAAERARYDDTTKCILCAACTSVVPVVLGPAVVRRAGGDRQRPPVHLRFPRRGRRRAARDPRRQGRRVALPDDLQLHRRLPARDPHHPGDPRGERRDRGARGLSEPFFPELESPSAADDRPTAARRGFRDPDGRCRAGQPGTGVARCGFVRPRAFGRPR